MTRTKPLQRKTRIRPVSKKRQEQNREYARLRKEFLEEHPTCRVCSDLGMDGGTVTTVGPNFVMQHRVPVCASDIHHMAHREAKLLLDTRFFLPVCREHHRFIHDNPQWALEKGYLLPPEQRRKLA